MIIVCISKSGYTHHGRYYYYGELLSTDNQSFYKFNSSYWRPAKSLERDLYHMGIRSMPGVTKF
jgi:hypothetical protein